MKNFTEYVEEHSLPADTFQDALTDSVLSNNLRHYFNGWMRTEGINMLHEFWNSRSDACPLDHEDSDRQVISFREWVLSQFKDTQP